jgi:hypothetical protein
MSVRLYFDPTNPREKIGLIEGKLRQRIGLQLPQLIVVIS